MTQTLEWASAATGPVFRERQTLTYRALPDGIGSIDWSTRLEAAKALTLDRTPYTTWGGYGGLSFRSSRDVHGASLLLPGGECVQNLTGQPGDWVVMQGVIDGGRDQKVALGLIDHPSNPRSPSPWYCEVGPEVNFMNAAFLFHGPRWTWRRARRCRSTIACCTATGTGPPTNSPRRRRRTARRLMGER